MLGRFLNLNKKKTKILSNHMSQYFIHNITENKCLNRESLHFYLLNELISNFMPATGLKKVGTGQQMADKARHFEKVQLGEHLATN